LLFILVRIQAGPPAFAATPLWLGKPLRSGLGRHNSKSEGSQGAHAAPEFDERRRENAG